MEWLALQPPVHFLPRPPFLPSLPAPKPIISKDSYLSLTGRQSYPVAVNGELALSPQRSCCLLDVLSGHCASSSRAKEPHISFKLTAVSPLRWYVSGMWFDSSHAKSEALLSPRGTARFGKATLEGSS
ncbi:hypothetical protein SRHO_G00051630 [Serrasalmus rhombeus]